MFQFLENKNKDKYFVMVNDRAKNPKPAHPYFTHMGDLTRSLRHVLIFVSVLDIFA